jgi:hypothetical protein
MLRSGNNRKYKPKKLRFTGEDGKVIIVTKTVVPPGEIKLPEKFKKANEILLRTRMLPG